MLFRSTFELSIKTYTMTIRKEQLEKAFKDYYAERGVTATHVFVYSEKQRKRKEDGLFDFGDIISFQTYLKGVEYSEMYSRDSGQTCNWDDSKFVGVGTYSDVKHEKS